MRLPRLHVGHGPPLLELVQRHVPGGQIVEVTPLGADTEDEGTSHKAVGYGRPLRLTVRDPDGRLSRFVFHTESENDFGHDRRSDRAASTLLAFDTFRSIPNHVPALDVGAVRGDGRLQSLGDAGELYLLTEWVDGTLYAEDLRTIAERGHATVFDVRRCEALVGWLVGLHAEAGQRPARYTRSIRDLIGHGEGVFGIVDGYPPDTPAAPERRLREIERRCVDWRWRLRGQENRLRRTHGDFHPFNVVFGEDTELTLLDASRGGQGDPADDVSCMALNYVFFALQARPAWWRGFGLLWDRFWRGYLEQSRDPGVLDVAAPFLAWRALVMASPRWYPDVSPDVRDALLGFVEAALDRSRFDPASADALFR